MVCKGRGAMVNRTLSACRARRRKVATTKPSFKRNAIRCRALRHQDGGRNVQRKVFRIDAMGRGINTAPSGPEAQALTRHSELLREIRALRSISSSSEEVSERMLESYKAQIFEAQKLKN